MATYKVHWKASTREVRVLHAAEATPGGFTALGTFDHNDDADDELGVDGAAGTDNHVFYHHVQDLLYTEAGVENMQSLTIDIPRLVSISGGADRGILNAATNQIVVTPTPANAVNTNYTYTTSDPAKATVSATGLVTAGATDGTVTITITANDRDADGGIIDDSIVYTVS